ncbi:MAG: 3-methyl-2-oxobutanoate dehydrogenase subunit beta, partial [Oligoflexales bacterium]|nr:3-methyl-2-oxobutanoate dehydrogenase subunit beta [Oligoflexales bacterium]
PITLFPFPEKRIREISERAKVLAVLELSNGQMYEDVMLSAREKCPIEFYGRMGGAVLSHEEATNKIKEIWQKHRA